PAQGAVDASPDADSKVNTPGSRLGGRQCPPPEVSAHAGVTVIGAVNEPVGTSFTLSVSFGVVDVLTMVILAENVLPTGAVAGQVGVLPPPIPASARGAATPRSSSPMVPRTAQVFTVFPPFVEGSTVSSTSRIQTPLFIGVRVVSRLDYAR